VTTDQPDHSIARSLELLLGKISLLADKPVPRCAIAPRKPDTFDGLDPQKLDNFVFQCSMHFAVCSADFPDDESRVSFMLSYLSSTPLDWFRTEINHALSLGTLPPWFTSCPDFISELHRLFGPLNPATDAMTALESLRYDDTSKATRYTTDFNYHARRTGWNDPALTRQYYKGLSECLKDELTIHT